MLALTATSANTFSFIASHPAAASLEAVLCFLLQEDDLCVRLAGTAAGENTLVTVLTSVILAVTSTITEAMMIDANIRDFEIITKNSQIVTLVESILSENSGNSWEDFQQPFYSPSSSPSSAGNGTSGSGENKKKFDASKAKQIRLGSLKTLRDLLFSPPGGGGGTPSGSTGSGGGGGGHSSLTSGDVLLLGFLALQVILHLNSFYFTRLDFLFRFGLRKIYCVDYLRPLLVVFLVLSRYCCFTCNSLYRCAPMHDVIGGISALGSQCIASEPPQA